ncbi:MAG: selenium-dependent xanthine dehydrogenase, partial [Sporomusa sp.]|nr:selenium-dependent xanthine dehydrogenase [Sporomusa sp.]
LIVEEPEQTGPFGAKGVGEPTLIPTAAAIANAVYNAIGIRFTELPITPEKVLDRLQEFQNAKV